MPVKPAIRFVPKKLVDALFFAFRAPNLCFFEITLCAIWEHAFDYLPHYAIFTIVFAGRYLIGLSLRERFFVVRSHRGFICRCVSLANALFYLSVKCYISSYIAILPAVQPLYDKNNSGAAAI